MYAIIKRSRSVFFVIDITIFMQPDIIVNLHLIESRDSVFLILANQHPAPGQRAAEIKTRLFSQAPKTNILNPEKENAMNRIIQISCIALVICLAFIQAVISETNWKMLGDKKGVQYFEASVQGSKFKQFMGTTIIDASPETVIELLRDVEAYKDWVHDCKDLKLIKALGGNDENICYYVYDSQFPVKDRDTVVKSVSFNRIDQGKINVKVDSIEYPDYKLDDSNVKMQMHVQFLGEYIGRNKTKLTMQFSFEPGGSISPGLVHGFVRMLPFHSLVNLKEMVKKEKYVDKGRTCRELPQIEAYAKKIGK